VNESTEAFACERDRHLFGPGPKHILSLDGGGVRGAITVAFLERIEKLLEERYGKEVRLGDHFDLIGGTSTGALISGALALGHRASEIKEFYTDRAQHIFQAHSWRLPVLQAKFDAAALRAEIASFPAPI
jgi:patatin-like phospholipase/acyl hydrolase